MNIVSGIKNRKQYSNYKDSGVEWLGQVPEHWSLWKLSHAFRLIGSGTTPQTDNLDFYNGDISWVTTSELRENLIIDTNSKLTSKALKQYPMLFLYPPGTLLIAMYGATIGRLGILGILACTNQACCAFSHPVALDIKYAFYWLLMRRREIVLMSSGGGQPNVNQEKLRSLKIPAPGLDEQRTIATFLDRETAKIDALIAKKERLIELLQEKRAALISHAVTKGLDPSAPMKDSGVEWLGKVPATWSVIPIKFAAKLESGHTPSRQHPEYWENCNIPWISLSDVWQLRDRRQIYINETNECISEMGLANSSARLLPAGTVVLSRTASVGFSGILQRPMATTQDFVNWICGPHLLPKFLLYVFHGMASEFKRLTMGSTHQTIYMPDVSRFVMPLPPCNEQAEIINYIDNTTLNIDTLHDWIKKSIEKLKEYRTALISAAVTGKIDVRDEAGVVA